MLELLDLLNIMRYRGEIDQKEEPTMTNDPFWPIACIMATLLVGFFIYIAATVGPCGHPEILTDIERIALCR